MSTLDKYIVESPLSKTGGKVVGFVIKPGTITLDKLAPDVLEKLDRETYKSVCNTIADAPQKQCSVDNFMLSDGILLAVTFTYGITSANTTLNINNTGSILLYRKGELLTGGTVSPKATLLMVYEAAGNRWNILSGVDAEIYWSNEA